MGKQPKEPQGFLPLVSIDYHILLTLIGRSRHGYEIMKQIEKEIGKDIPAPKIYRYLRNLTDDGLIEIDEKATAEAADPRRRYYRATSLGQTICIEETKRLSDLVGTARNVLGRLAPEGVS